MAHDLPTHDQLPRELTWDLTPLYASDAAWEADFTALAEAEQPVVQLQGRLGESPALLAQCLDQRDDLFRRLDKLYTYAHLRSDEDTGNSAASGRQDRARARWAQLSAALAFIEPELLALPEARFEALAAAAELQPYARLLEVLRRDRPHTLSAGEEKLLAMAAEPLAVAHQAFSKLNNADLKFPEVTDAAGQQVRLTHGNYITFLEAPQRAVRRAAFEATYDTYETVKNTLAATIDGHVRKQVFQARARHFPSALAASLHNDQVQPQLYHSLITAIHGGLPVFFRYLDLRRRALGLDKLDMYDLHVPILPAYELEVPYAQACEWVLAAVAPLGEEYAGIVRQGMQQRWIDVLECRGKRSGAYSSGCYDSNPYILLNHQDNLNGAFTLIHELGHSLHSYLSRRAQPHLYASYSIVVAEVASITNELLLFHYLLRTSADRRLKAYLLNHLCNDFRTTVFRQTMFAEFELLIHQRVEQGQPLTTDALCEAYYDLNRTYYGDYCTPDRRIQLEWARIPHFYYNFYVYKYATGFAAAQAFAGRLLSGDQGAVQAYLGFLRAGSTKDPLDILAEAGVDLRDPAVIANAITRFGQAIDELAPLL